MADQLKYLSDKALLRLRSDIGNNLERYLKTGFADLGNDPGWDVTLGIDFDAARLSKLDLSQPQKIAAIDLKNSIIVGEALGGLNPAIANEERIWVRLAHIEALEYCRARWIRSATEAQQLAEITTHLFASTQTGIRDEHALSRLWWNYEIARICQPDDIKGALQLIVMKADIRSNFVERIWMTSRRNIAGAVLRSMKSDPWVTSVEDNFRKFMKSLNRLGGGIVFEALSESETDAFVKECVAYAKVAA